MSKDLDRLAESIRKANSDDSAYQHMLDTIANDVEKEFWGLDHTESIAEFIRGWTPHKSDMDIIAEQCEAIDIMEGRDGNA